MGAHYLCDDGLSPIHREKENRGPTNDILLMLVNGRRKSQIAMTTSVRVCTRQWRREHSSKVHHVCGTRPWEAEWGEAKAPLILISKG